MAKRIGILGGISHESTISYYDLILKKYYERFQDYYYPEIVIFSLDFQKFTDYEDQRDLKGYIPYIMEGINALQNAGVGFIAMSANSPHIVFDLVREQASVPMLSIVDTTIQAAARAGMKKLLLMGIKFTMRSTFYQAAGQQAGIEVLVPSETEQDEINRIVFEELSLRKIKPESKTYLLEMIHRYPVDGVILGCTELPMILNQQDTAVPLLDTVELHTQAILDYAMTPD